MSDTYIPIACSLHDEYEVAIMREKKIELHWRDDDGGRHIEKVLPGDILVKNGQEFLIAYTDDGDKLCLRLDRISLVI